MLDPNVHGPGTLFRHYRGPSSYLIIKIDQSTAYSLRWKDQGFIPSAAGFFFTSLPAKVEIATYS